MSPGVQQGGGTPEREGSDGPLSPWAGALRLASFLARTMPGNAAAAILLVGATILLQAFAAILVLGVLAALGIPGAASPVEALVARLGWRLDIPLALIMLSSVAIAAAFAGFAQESKAARLHRSAVERIRRRLVDALDGLEWETFQRMKRSDVAHAMTLQAEQGGQAVHLLVLLVADVGVAAVYIAGAFLIQPLLTAGVIVVAGMLLLLVRPWTRTAMASGIQLGGAQGRLVHDTLAWLQGMKAMRFLPPPPLEPQQVRDLHLRAERGRLAGRLLFEVAGVLVLAVAVALAAGPLGMAAGSILFLIYLYARVLPTASRAAYLASGLAHLLPAFHAADSLAASLEAAGEGRRPGTTPELTQGLELRDVVYRHPGAASVGPLTFSVPAGRVTALHGPSGSGKTTALDLAAGLLSPGAGTLLVDGQELVDRRAWRHHVAYVPQEPFLLDASVAENLAWAAPDATPDHRAAALRELAPDVAVDAPAGERGHRLSGGQRKRVALAMALLRRPRLLVVDEPTAELDEAAARVVLDALADIAKRHGVTVLMATHGTAPDGANIVELRAPSRSPA